MLNSIIAINHTDGCDDGDAVEQRPGEGPGDGGLVLLPVPALLLQRDDQLLLELLEAVCDLLGPVVLVQHLQWDTGVLDISRYLGGHLHAPRDLPQRVGHGEPLVPHVPLGLQLIGALQLLHLQRIFLVALKYFRTWKINAPMMQYPTTRESSPMWDSRKEVTDLASIRRHT